MNYLERVAWEIFVLAGNDDKRDFEEYKVLWLGYAVLCLTKGQDVTSEDVHDVWSMWATLTTPEHKSLIPFDELAEGIQALDNSYRDAIAQRAYLSGWERKEPSSGKVVSSVIHVTLSNNEMQKLLERYRFVGHC